MIKGIIMNKTFFAIFALALSIVAHAGDHHESVDRFDGTVTRVFRTNIQEFREGGGQTSMQLSDFDEDTQTFLLSLGSERPTRCDQNYVELRTADGVIHRLDAREIRLRFCFVRVKADYVKRNFTVRIPMFSGDSVILRMDTSTLDPFRLKK
jgi:hypothetical protein